MNKVEKFKDLIDHYEYKKAAKMYYDLASGDVNVAGHYKLQGRVSLSSSTYYTNVYNFQVHCNI